MGFAYISVYNALGSSWAPRWVSAEVELGSFLPSVAQRFPSVSFGPKIFRAYFSICIRLDLCFRLAVGGFAW